MNAKELRNRHWDAHGMAALLTTVTGLLAGLGASGQVFITVVGGEVQEGAPSAALDLRVTNGGAPVQLLGVNLNVQVADGGPLAGGSVLGPPIVGVSLFDVGMLFAGNNNGAGGNGLIVPQIFEIGTLTQSGTLTLGTGDFLLGRVQFNTTGFVAGQNWNITLDTLNGSSALLNSSALPLSSTLVSGQLSMAPVPEPATTAAFAGAALVGFCFWHRTRRKHPAL